MHKSNKGFTLTEMLIVVVVMGILAAVILPKFNKVFMTRQTTEAEQILGAVRQQQELLCVEEGHYNNRIEDTIAFDSLVKVNGGRQVASKYFVYFYDGFNTIVAESRSAPFSLVIPSFADGRICCFGPACEELNKDYPDCDDLEDSEDFIEGNSCAF